MKIHIAEFGPIKDADIAIAPMLLMTGNSNMGKSYANYLFYFLMRAITRDMFVQIVERKFEKMKQSDAKLVFQISENDLRKWLVDNVRPFMAKFLGNEDLTCDVSFFLDMDDKIPDGIIKVEYIRKRNMDSTDESPLETMMSTISVNGEVSSSTTFANDRRAESQHLAFSVSRYFQIMTFGHTFMKSVILPPARGSYVGESYTAKEMIATQAEMYKAFLTDYDFALHASIYGAERSNDDQFFLSRMKTLMKGELTTKDNKQFLLMNNGKELPLTAAASSIKELSPFFFYLKNWSRYSFSFCIEEPEAHLHPTMQKDVADLLAACLNKGMYFQMTTHSDYFLQRVNQLILLGRLREKDASAYEEFRKSHGLNQRFYLNGKDVVCYYFHEDDEGGVKIDELKLGEEGLPLTSFFGIVSELTSFEDDLNIALCPEKYEA